MGGKRRIWYCEDGHFENRKYKKYINTSLYTACNIILFCVSINSTYFQYGDTLHTLVDRTKYKGFFLPGFVKASEDILLKQLYVCKSAIAVAKAVTISLKRKLEYFNNDVSQCFFWTKRGYPFIRKIKTIFYFKF